MTFAACSPFTPLSSAGHTGQRHPAARRPEASRQSLLTTLSMVNTADCPPDGGHTVHSPSAAVNLQSRRATNRTEGDQDLALQSRPLRQQATHAGGLAADRRTETVRLLQEVWTRQRCLAPQDRTGCVRAVARQSVAGPAYTPWSWVQGHRACTPACRRERSFRPLLVRCGRASSARSLQGGRCMEPIFGPSLRHGVNRVG